jgi:hypothetical protein
VKSPSMVTPLGIALSIGLALAWPSVNRIGSHITQAETGAFEARRAVSRRGDVTANRADPNSSLARLPYKIGDTNAMPFASTERRRADLFLPASFNGFANRGGGDTKLYRLNPSHGATRAERNTHDATGRVGVPPSLRQSAAEDDASPSASDRRLGSLARETGGVLPGAQSVRSFPADPVRKVQPVGCPVCHSQESGD